MAVLNTGYTWPTSGTWVSTNANNAVNNATFASGAYDNSTITLNGSGAMQVKDLGVTTGKIANSAVTPAKLDATGAYTMDDITANKARLVPFAVAQSTSTMTLNLNDGNFFVVTLTADVTTVAALANMVNGKQFTIIVKNSTNGGTGFAISGWASTWKWQGGTAPSLTASDTGIDIISGVTDGTNAYVTMIKNFA